jgi:hypothetical protein
VVLLSVRWIVVIGMVVVVVVGGRRVKVGRCGILVMVVRVLVRLIETVKVVVVVIGWV